MAREDLGTLTKGERLLIDRRRREETQTEAAARLETPLARYSLAERDRAELPGRQVAVGRLKGHERCLLYRRRSGVKQHEVATALGVCRRTLMLMEMGKVNCDALVHYWEC